MISPDFFGYRTKQLKRIRANSLSLDRENVESLDLRNRLEGKASMDMS